MNKNEKKIINGKLYKSNKSIPSTIGKDSAEENNNTKSILSHHRKNISSFFIGSYIADNDLNKLLYSNDITTYESKRITNFSYEKENNSLPKNANVNVHELNNSSLKEKENNLNSSNTNLNTNDNDKNIPFSNSSFYSFTNENEEYKDEAIQNNTLKTVQTLTNDMTINLNEFNYINLPYKESGNNFNSNEIFSREKSFLPMKNSLKYIKDKEERVTESYLMALNAGEIRNNDDKRQYLATVSIIEEEKSDFVDTTNKKASIINNSLLLLDKEFKKRKIENEFQDNKNQENKENINNNIINDYKYKKLNFDLNKIIIKNRFEEENKEKCIKKNKTNINYFNKKNSNIKLNQKLSNKKIDLISKIKNNKNNSKNKIIIKTSRKNDIFSPPAISVKKRRTLSHCETNKLALPHQKIFNTENKAKKNMPKENYNIFNLIGKKIIHNIYNNHNDNMKEKEAKNKLNKSLNNLLISRTKMHAKVPRIKFLDNKKKEIKICDKKLQHNLSINNFSKQKKESKISLKLKHKKSISFSNPTSNNNYKHKKTFTNINSVEREKNTSKIKPKIKKIIKRTDKIYKNITKSKSKDKNLTLKNSHINSTIKFIKEKITFSKDNEKNRVLKTFLKNADIDKDNYIIFC